MQVVMIYWHLRQKVTWWNKEKLNAGVFRDRRMYIDENAAQKLLDKYMRK